jgi:cytochrome c-type biogenesis protein CcmH/NrfG
MLSYSAALRRDPAYKPALDAISELEFQTSGIVDQATLDRLPEIRERARTSPESLTNVQLMALLEERARVAPDDPIPHRIMGQILQGFGHVDKAEVAYTAALKLNPNDRDALKSLADMRFKASGTVDPETAELYHKAYRLDRSDLRIGYMAGIGDWLQGKKAEAEALWASIEADPANDATHRQMFAAMRQMFKIDPATPEPSKTEGASKN